MRHVKQLAALTMAMLVLGAGAAYALSPVLKEMEDAFIRLHEELRPCVVNIDSKGAGGTSEMDMEQFHDLFRFFGMPNPEPGPNAPRIRIPPRMATGSGFIYDKEGHIVTNNHVVDDADEITVKLWNDKEYPAKVVGRDPDTDLAVIKIEPDTDLPVARLGDSDGLKVGQFAIAVGSPRGFEGSFSFGHISALGREDLSLPGLRFWNFIQTDAAINLGNSGGPLCDLDGEVIGISIAIVYGANSLGFAIPINTAKQIVPQLISTGKITRGFLGVEITNVKPFMEGVGLGDDKGAFVKRVQSGSPAERADIKPYDVVRKVNGQAVENSADLIRKISGIPPGSQPTLEIWRDKAPVEVRVTLEEYAGDLKTALKGKEVLGLQVQNRAPEVTGRRKIYDQNGEITGVLVTQVEPGSAAEEAGFVPGDVIFQVAQKIVNSTDDFYRLVKENAVPGKSLLIGYIHAGSGEADISVIKVPKDAEIK
jgi:serine protease Do